MLVVEMQLLSSFGEHNFSRSFNHREMQIASRVELSEPRTIRRTDDCALASLQIRICIRQDYCVCVLAIALLKFAIAIALRPKPGCPARKHNNSERNKPKQTRADLRSSSKFRLSCVYAKRVCSLMKSRPPPRSPLTRAHDHSEFERPADDIGFEQQMSD